MKHAAFATTLLLSAYGVGAASASTLHLDGYTSSVQSVNISNSPVAGTPGNAGATGFNITDTSGSMGSFVAWCLDVAHYLMNVGDSQNYNVTATPYSNSYGLTAVGHSRVQSVFDANYASVDVSNGDQAAAFQMSLWEAAFEDDGNAMSVTSGLFQATSSGSTTLANTYLANAATYAGAQMWNLTFLEVDGPANRQQNSGQNLVTVSPVPLPAAGLLVLTGLLGFGAVSRRRTSKGASAA